MRWVRWVRERLLALVSRERMDAEMEEELRFHLDQETAKNIRNGMSPGEARRQALIAFGGVERFKEKTREARGVRPLEEAVRDFRFAVRSLRRAPGVVVVTVLSLGLGIAASSTVFSVANALVLGDAGPMEDPDGVVAVYVSDDDGDLYGETSFPDYTDLASRTQTLEGLAAHRMGVATVGDPASGDRMILELVSGNYFQLLGVQPILGRAFFPEETEAGQAHRLFILSHRTWQVRFGEDPGVLGRTIELNGDPFTIIGVAPQGMAARFMKMEVDGWVPLGVEGGIYRVTPATLRDRSDRQFFMLGRMAKGKTVAEVQSEMALLAARLHEEHPQSWADLRGERKVLTVVPEAESRVPPPARVALLGVSVLFLAGAFLILLLACSNVASLLLARGHRRSWEMAVRLSLGAGRGHLIRMHLMESLVLAILGGGLGLYLTKVATDYFGAVPLPFDAPLRFDFGVDGRVLLFTAVVALGACLLAGIGPALRGSRPSLSPALKHDLGMNDGKGRWFSLSSALVVGQVTTATILVIGAGLAARSVQASATYDLGLDAEGVAVAWKEPPGESLSPDELRTYFLEFGQRIAAHPEIESVALARTAEAHLFMEDFATAQVEAEGGESSRIPFNAITPGYMEMLRIPLVRGRSIQDMDGPGAPRVAVVNQTFADRFFPEGDPLGRQIHVANWFDADGRQDLPGATLQVVGVTAAPSRPDGAQAGPFFWVSYLQDPPVRAIIHARGRNGAAPAVKVLREEMPPAPGDFTLIDPGPYAEYIEYRFLGNRLITAILSFAGLFALILAFVGVFGIVSVTVNRRYREMAIRQALGARKRGVMASVLRHGLRGTLVGIFLGLGLSIPLAFLARSQLLGVAPLDPLAMGGGTAVLLLASLLAGGIPALRLRRAEPMTILREE